MNLAVLSRHAASLIAALALAPCAAPAGAAEEVRSVTGFDSVLLEVAGELQISQGPQESLAVEAEPAVLRMIVTEVRDRRLRIGLRPGRVETREPIRFRLGVRQLRAFESRTAAAVTTGPLRTRSLALGLGGGGSIHVDRLQAQELEVSLTGAGEVAIGGGSLQAQRIEIRGIGRYEAPALDCERSRVAIDGNGQAHLAAARSLDVRIGGVGQVRYRGDPAVTRSIAGIGTVEKD